MGSFGWREGQRERKSSRDDPIKTLDLDQQDSKDCMINIIRENDIFQQKKNYAKLLPSIFLILVAGSMLLQKDMTL